MSTTTTALISGGVSLLVAGVTTAGAYLLQRTRLRDDFRQQDHRLQAELERQREKAADDLRQQEHRLFAELRTEFMAEAAIRQLLTLPDWELRSFAAIRERIGGFKDDELRRLLVRSGAVRFKGAGNTEMWGLRERNAARLGRSGDGPAEPPPG